MNWFWDFDRLATKQELQEGYKNLLCMTIASLLALGFFCIASIVDSTCLGAAIAWAVLVMVFWIDMVDKKRSYINRFMLDKKSRWAA